MSTQTFAETRTSCDESSRGPWEAMQAFQNRVIGFWLTAFARPWLYHDPGGIEDAGVQVLEQEALTEPAPRDVESVEEMPPAPHAKEKQAVAQVEDAGSGAPKTRGEMPVEAQLANRSRARSPARKRGPRQPTRDKKTPERTGRASPAVMAGLRHRSYSVKLAAVTAMTTNRKLRSQEAVPLLERIVDNQTIRRRDPELRAAARKVLQQSRRELRGRSE